VSFTATHIKQGVIFIYTIYLFSCIREHQKEKSGLTSM
jgi:hypothetical protein